MHAPGGSPLAQWPEGTPIVAAWRTNMEYGGARSTPSGSFKYPGAVPTTPMCPYCHTMRPVRGSTTITRALRSSLHKMSPFVGIGSHSEGSATARLDGDS